MKNIVYSVSVQLVGETPLLMHKMTVGALDAKPKSADTDYSSEWINTCYLGDGVNLICPSANIESMLVAVSSGKKIKKVPVVKLVSQLNIAEMDIPLTIDGKSVTVDVIKKNNWIDVRGVVVQRNRVARSRACIPAGWTLDFTIESKTSLISPDYLKSLLEESGELVGLMDYRPQKKGKFGQFEISRFETV